MLDFDLVLWLALALAVVALVPLAIWVGIRGRRSSERLQQQFGEEYERALESSEDRRVAEADLEDRLEQHERLELRSLSEEAQRRYLEAWERLQLGFVDAPAESVQGAARLVEEALAARGYPAQDFEATVKAVSVDYPHLAQRYREAQVLPLDVQARPPNTERLRQALLDYRLLLEELLELPGDRTVSPPPPLPGA